MAEFNLAASVPRSRYRARWLTVTLSRLSRALEKRTEPLLSLLATPVLFLPLKTILTARTAEKSQFHSAAVTFCAALWGCRVPSWHVICNMASPGEAFTGEKSGSWCLTPRGYIKLLLCAERTEYSMGWKKDTEEGECILGGMEKKKKARTPGDGGALDWYQKWWEGKLLLTQLKWKRVRGSFVRNESDMLRCLWLILYGHYKPSGN